MKNLLTLLLVFIFQGLYSQTVYDKYTWDIVPASGIADTMTPVKGAIVEQEKRITEIYLNQDDYFEEINVLHRKFRLETTPAIDNYNKIYIPIDDVLETIAIKARFISPSGTITELPRESIRKIENLENKGNFNVFAIEGAEAGGHLEYYYILRKKFDPFGTVYIQEDIPKSHVEVIYSFPDKLGYLIKSYNGFPPFRQYKGDNQTSIMKSVAGNIPALESEPYSFYRANLMRYEFTLSFNRYISAIRVNSWAKACRNVYSNTFQFEKKELSAARALVKKMNIPQGSEEMKIRYIENRIKSEISISDDSRFDASIDQIILNRYTGEHGAIRLFAALFDAAGINYELVLTSDNTDHPFDPEFNGYNFLQKQLFYFPAIDKYLMPDNEGYRIGLIPAEIQGAFALFTKIVSPNEELRTLSFKIGQIPVEKSAKNADTLLQTIGVDLASNQLNIKLKRIFSGLNASPLQSFWHLIDQDRKEEIIQSIFNLGVENSTISSWEVINTEPENAGLKPLVWNLDMTGNAHVESAGSDLLIKIGETIGTQSELYKDNQRKLPVNLEYLRSYYRVLDFVIPEGYEAKNADDLNMNIVMDGPEGIHCAFRSAAVRNGNVIRITIDEFYNNPFYPVEQYEEYRKVINAAADFNKKTLLLTKIL